MLYKFPQTASRIVQMKWSGKSNRKMVLAEDEIGLIRKYRELPKEKQAKLSGMATERYK